MLFKLVFTFCFINEIYCLNVKAHTHTHTLARYICHPMKTGAISYSSDRQCLVLWLSFSTFCEPTHVKGLGALKLSLIWTSHKSGNLGKPPPFSIPSLLTQYARGATNGYSEDGKELWSSLLSYTFYLPSECLHDNCILSWKL